MKPINSFLKVNIIGQLILILCLLSFLLNESYAKAGCCARHGGVAGCNTSTGMQKCQDGSTSPSCGCDGKTIHNVKKATGLKKTNLLKKSTKTTPGQHSTALPLTPAKTAGCCARHGGVSKCDKATGRQKCKDGTISGTCKC